MERLREKFADIYFEVRSAFLSCPAVSTLHDYEFIGLIGSNRTSGNQRRYEPNIIRRLRIIGFAQEFGVSLKEFGEAFSVLPEDRPPTMAEWEKTAKKWEQKGTPALRGFKGFESTSLAVLFAVASRYSVARFSTRSTCVPRRALAHALLSVAKFHR